MDAKVELPGDLDVMLLFVAVTIRLPLGRPHFELARGNATSFIPMGF
jgi:hypothetical protein